MCACIPEHGSIIVPAEQDGVNGALVRSADEQYIPVADTITLVSPRYTIEFDA